MFHYVTVTYIISSVGLCMLENYIICMETCVIVNELRIKIRECILYSTSLKEPEKESRDLKVVKLNRTLS